VRAVREMIDAMMRKDMAAGLQIINQAVDSGSDPRQFCQQVVDHLRAVMLTQAASPDLVEASQEDRQMYARQAGQISRPGLMKALKTFNDVLNGDISGWQPQLALELALIESLTETVEAQPATLFAPAPAAAAAPNQPPEPERAPQPSAPGTPPTDAPSMVREKWADAQRLIQQSVMSDNRYVEMRTLPDLMQHAVVLSVDGNKLTMGVKARIHLSKLNETGRIRWIERALKRVLTLNEDIIVRFVQSDGGATGEMSYITPSPDVIDDPLIQEGTDLGAQIEIEDD
jgi:DNA polymerase-3 subunit gamma/tau